MKNTLALAAGGLWLVWVVSLLVFKRRPELRVGKCSADHGLLREAVGRGKPVAAPVVIDCRAG